MTPLRRAVLALALIAAPIPSLLVAQDTTRGVHLGLGYLPGTKVVLAVLRVAGPQGDSVQKMLQRDLDYGDRVDVRGQNPDDLPPVSGQPDFDLFAKLGIAGVVQTTVTPDGLNVHVWNIATKSFNVLGIPLQGKPLSPEWRLSVHFASDQIELWATGAPGISATRIAFKRDGKLWTIDSDGANATLIPGTDGAMSPSWHPSGRYLTYNLLPIEGMASAIVVRDLVTGSVQRIATAGRSGTYLTPVFSPDGGSLIYAYGLDQGTDLYLMDWAHPSSQPMRVTSTHTENTSPTFSPDGRRIAFTSGRLGPPQVYIADADGSSADPLTNSGFGEQSYRSNPAWSPDGRVIAIQSRINGVFQIVTVSPGGGIETLLTNEGQNEDPSWAPDGRHIVFKSNRTGSEQLWILDHESGRSRQLTHGSESKLAAWSPPLMRQKPSDRPDSPRTGGKQ